MSFSQNDDLRISKIKDQLELLSIENPGLTEQAKIEINVNNITLSSFILAISNAHSVNINIDPELNQISIANNNYSTSIILSFVVVFILVGVDILENTFQALSKGVHTKYTNWKQQPTPFRLRKVFNPKNKEKQ